MTALLAHGDPAAEAIFAAEKQHDPSGDGQKYAYVAEAARPRQPSSSDISKTFCTSLSAGRLDRTKPLCLQLLGPVRAHSALPENALEALPQIKRERKIFFLVDWLTAFIEGQQSPAAQAQVYAYLDSAGIDDDLR